MQPLARNVFVLNHEVDYVPYATGGWHWYHPYFKDKIVITLHLHHRPEKVWPSDNEMIAYCNQGIGILLGAGVINLDRGEFERLTQNFDGASRLDIAAVFPTVEVATEAFERAVNAGFVDIYLYKDGHIYRKYD